MLAPTTSKIEAKIKVLHIINDLSRNGGAQRFVIDLINPPPQNYEIKVITLNEENDFLNELKGVECYVWKTLSFTQKWRLLRWPDLLHGHLFPSIYLSLASIGKKRIQTEHATHNRRRDHFYLKPFEFFLYWRHHITVCITTQVKERLEDFLPYLKSHYRVISNGIDVHKFSFTQKIIPQQNENIHIGMVGRFHPYKDQPTLFRALSLLPDRYHLHLVGDGELKEEYLACVQNLGLEKRVTFHGVCADIPGFLDTLNLYVQSSVVEGFGLAALEAMASGLPVLASRVQGMKEVIAKDSALFDVGNEKELALKIESICNCPAQYQASSLYSLSRCQDFSLQRFREQYYQIYQSVIDEQIP